jgi:hypothetical protein
MANTQSIRWCSLMFVGLCLSAGVGGCEEPSESEVGEASSAITSYTLTGVTELSLQAVIQNGQLVLTYNGTVVGEEDVFTIIPPPGGGQFVLRMLDPKTGGEVSGTWENLASGQQGAFTDYAGGTSATFAFPTAQQSSFKFSAAVGSLTYDPKFILRTKTS